MIRTLVLLLVDHTVSQRYTLIRIQVLPFIEHFVRKAPERRTQVLLLCRHAGPEAPACFSFSCKDQLWLHQAALSANPGRPLPHQEPTSHTCAHRNPLA